VTLASLWLGIMWVAAIPPMAAPDEPAYLQAVIETRNKRMIPESHFDFSTNPLGEPVGDPGDAAAREYAIQHNQGDSLRLTPYQNSQPPLYFMVTGPVAMLLPSDAQTILYASRLISALFGAGMVFFCWAAMRELAPRQPMWAVGVAAVIALLPQFCFNNARVGNDSMVNFLGAAAFYVWFRGLRRPDYDRWMLLSGAVVGLAFLAKLTAVALIPGLALVVLFRAFQTGTSDTRWRERVVRGARMAAGAAGAGLAVCGWWIVRNMIVYGDPSGTNQVNRFYQMRLKSPGFGLATPEQRAIFTDSVWKSFWGNFGWEDKPMPSDFYAQIDFFTRILVGLTVVAVVGFTVRWVIRRLRFGEAVTVPAHAWQAAIILVVVSVALILAFIQYNLAVTDSPQGRYLFMALLPGAILFTGGLYALAPHRVLKAIVLSIPILWLATINFVSLVLVR
jgi:4-amino-4-deoxy-L-arabinose transferase-like glycosyltransferase